VFSIPFAAYDVFGYLAAGAVALGGLQQLTGFPALYGRSLTAIETGAAILAMYVAGQLVATPSEAVLEDWLLHRVVGPPSEILFRRRQSRWRYAFPGYHEALTPATRDRVLSRAEEHGVKGAGEQLFQLARHSQRVTGDQQAMSRLATFLAQYGCARNIAFVCLLLGPALLIKARWEHQQNLAFYGVASLVVGITFVYRFLKFYRLYSSVVFNQFGRVADVDEGSVH